MRKGDLNSKLRIQYYKHIATNWMPAAGVDVLAMSTLDEPMLPYETTVLKCRIERQLQATQ